MPQFVQNLNETIPRITYNIVSILTYNTIYSFISGMSRLRTYQPAPNELERQNPKHEIYESNPVRVENPDRVNVTYAFKLPI